MHKITYETEMSSEEAFDITNESFEAARLFSFEKTCKNS